MGEYLPGQFGGLARAGVGLDRFAAGRLLGGSAAEVFDEGDREVTYFDVELRAGAPQCGPGGLGIAAEKSITAPFACSITARDWRTPSICSTPSEVPAVATINAALTSRS